MEFSDLLFWGIFIVAWFFSFLTKKAKTNKTPSEKKGFTLRILEFINELKEASEKETNNQTSVAPQQVAEPAIPQNVVSPNFLSTSARMHHAKPTAATVVKNQSAVMAEHSIKIAVPPQTTEFESNKKRGRKKFARQKMREAIVWSEILGRPVALRNNQ